MTGPFRSFLIRVLGPWVAELSPATLRADALAGVLGAVLVLPQAIAFAALAGLPPAMGLAAAVLPCIVAALAGSSRHVATGPTNATSLALGAMLVSLAAGSPAQLVALALVITLLVGLMQAGLALLRLGSLANFISPSVMLGFTTGASLLIGWYALAGLMGAGGRDTPLMAWAGGVSWPALGVGSLTLALALAGRRWWRQGPYMLLALLVAVGMAWALAQPAWQHQLAAWRPAGQALPVLRVVGDVPSAWQHGQWPRIDWALLPKLLPMALALAIIALGQSMAIAKALAQRSGQTLDVNRECLGQGLANISAAFTSGMVVCGSMNRSLPNLEAGARTPLASVAAGLLLVLLVAVAAPLLAWIPMAGVAGLLLLVAWTLIDQAGWVRAWRLDRTEFGIAALTAAATLVLHLEMAVLLGVMLSLVAYLWQASRPALRSMGFDLPAGQKREQVVIDGRPALPECPQLKMLRMEGAVWFGAQAHVADHLRRLREAPGAQRHLLVMAKSMNFVDLPGADLWDEECRQRRAVGGDLWFHRPRPPVLAMWQRTGFIDRLGQDHFFPHKQAAIGHIVPLLDDAICARCTVRLFDECRLRPGPTEPFEPAKG